MSLIALIATSVSAYAVSNTSFASGAWRRDCSKNSTPGIAGFGTLRSPFPCRGAVGLRPIGGDVAPLETSETWLRGASRSLAQEPRLMQVDEPQVVHERSPFLELAWRVLGLAGSRLVLG